MRPLAGFGSPTAIRVSVGTPDELDVLRGRARPRARSVRDREPSRCAVPSTLRRQLALLRARRKFRLLFLATLGSGVGTWMATIALTADIDDAHPLAVVGERALPRRPSSRPRRRPLRSARCSTGSRGRGSSSPPTSCGSPSSRRCRSSAAPAAIIVLAAVAGIANSFFRPAVLAGVPNLVDEEDLAHGTALLQATDWPATALGPVLGGLIVSRLRPRSRLLDQRGDVPLLGAAAPAHPRPPAAERAGDHARPLARPRARASSSFRRSTALLTVLVRFGFTMLATGLDQRQRDLPREATRSASRRVRLRTAVDRPGFGLVARKPRQRRPARAARRARRLRRSRFCR